MALRGCCQLAFPTHRGNLGRQAIMHEPGRSRPAPPRVVQRYDPVPARQRASEVLRFTGREPGCKGFLDAAHEVHAYVQVGGAVCQLLEAKREVHRLALLVGWEREPIAQVSGLLVVVPVHLGDVVTPATHLLYPAFARPDHFLSVLGFCHTSAPSSVGSHNETPSGSVLTAPPEDP